VQARGDVECYLLDKESFHGVLHARPELAELIAEVLSQRQARPVSDTQAAASQGPPSRQPELLSRIKQFFGLSHPSG